MKYFSARRRSMTRARVTPRLACTASVLVWVGYFVWLVWLVCLVGGCATYDDTQAPQSSSSGGQGGTVSTGGAAAGGAGRNQAGRAGSSGGAGSGGASNGDAGRAGSSVGEAGEGGALETAGASGAPSTAGGGAGASGAGASGAGAGGAGAGGAGAGGSLNSGGAGATSTAGAGGAPSPVLLSQGKTSSADSTQTGNVASLGNDGSVVTRWCAANSGLNHNWQVDLAALHTLSRIDITWEKSANYKFKIEGSSDGNTWAMLVDKQTTTSTASAQSYTLDTGPKARFVKLTVTGLPNTTTWASFYELQVFGY